MANDKLGRIISYDEDGAPIRADYEPPVPCTCKCAPEEHGSHGCKTWYGDKNTGFGCNCDWRQPSAKTLRSTHKDRLALECGRLIIEMLQQKEATGVGIRGLVFGWSHEELRQEIAQIVLKSGFENL